VTSNIVRTGTAFPQRIKSEVEYCAIGLPFYRFCLVGAQYYNMQNNNIIIIINFCCFVESSSVIDISITVKKSCSKHIRLSNCHCSAAVSGSPTCGSTPEIGASPYRSLVYI